MCVTVRSRTISGGDISVFVNFICISGVQGICAFCFLRWGRNICVKCAVEDNMWVGGGRGVF
jgi:hypothetical protein